MPIQLRHMIAAGVCLLWAGGAHAAGTITWVKSYDSAVTQAKQTHKLIMVDFYTDWCGWCKRLDAKTYPDKQVIQAVGQFVPIQLNAEQAGKALATKYNVHGFPTILFIDDAGKVESKIVGYMTAAPFAERLNLVATEHGGLTRLQARWKANPPDVDAGGKLAAIAALQEKIPQAESLVADVEKVDPDNSGDHLTLAYNMLGDHYQDKNDLDKAMVFFHKAASTGKATGNVAYARLSLAQCYQSKKKNTEALTELKTALALPDLAQDDKEMLAMYLKPLEKEAGSK
jgi:thioredoxin-like negative regulator of GroEL